MCLRFGINWVDLIIVFVDILKLEVVECMNKYVSVGDVNIRFSNLV